MVSFMVEKRHSPEAASRYQLAGLWGGEFLLRVLALPLRKLTRPTRRNCSWPCCVGIRRSQDGREDVQHHSPHSRFSLPRNRLGRQERSYQRCSSRLCRILYRVRPSLLSRRTETDEFSSQPRHSQSALDSLCPRTNLAQVLGHVSHYWFGTHRLGRWASGVWSGGGERRTWSLAGCFGEPTSAGWNVAPLTSFCRLVQVLLRWGRGCWCRRRCGGTIRAERNDRTPLGVPVLLAVALKGKFFLLDQSLAKLGRRSWLEGERAREKRPPWTPRFYLKNAAALLLLSPARRQNEVSSQ